MLISMNNITGVIEAKLKGLMTKISKNVFSQKRLTNFILYNQDNFDIILQTWLNTIITLNQQQKVFIFNSLKDILQQCYLPPARPLYITEFAQLLYQNFDLILQGINDKLVIFHIEEVLHYLGDYQIYTPKFIQFLLDKTSNLLYKIQMGLPLDNFRVPAKPQCTNQKEVGDFISKLNQNNSQIPQLLMLKQQEENIEKFSQIYIDINQLDELLRSKDFPNEKYKLAQIKNVEKSLLLFRKILMKDLCNRELLMLSLSENMEREVGKYLENENRMNDKNI